MFWLGLFWALAWGGKGSREGSPPEVQVMEGFYYGCSRNGQLCVNLNVYFSNKTKGYLDFEMFQGTSSFHSIPSVEFSFDKKTLTMHLKRSEMGFVYDTKRQASEPQSWGPGDKIFWNYVAHSKAIRIESASVNLWHESMWEKVKISRKAFQNTFIAAEYEKKGPALGVYFGCTHLCMRIDILSEKLLSIKVLSKRDGRVLFSSDTKGTLVVNYSFDWKQKELKLEKFNGTVSEYLAEEKFDSWKVERSTWTFSRRGIQVRFGDGERVLLKLAEDAVLPQQKRAPVLTSAREGCPMKVESGVYRGCDDVLFCIEVEFGNSRSTKIEFKPREAEKFHPITLHVEYTLVNDCKIFFEGVGGGSITEYIYRAYLERRSREGDALMKFLYYEIRREEFARVSGKFSHDGIDVYGIHVKKE